jgi:low affinity Fe/Cu permease
MTPNTLRFFQREIWPEISRVVTAVLVNAAGDLIRVSAVHNSFVGIEHLTDEELGEIRARAEEAALRVCRIPVSD